MEKQLVIDLEMCKISGKTRRKGDRNLYLEIIQIGAVVLDEDNRISDEFGIYVRPQYGEIDEEIRELTGISQEMVENAPLLADALGNMSKWMAGRTFHVLSWSETDYYQLKNEMRSKRIRNRMVEQLFENWSDMQRPFSNMIGLDYILSLEKVLEATSLTVSGKLHDGLDDARNTARILQAIRKHSYYHLELDQIEEKKEEVEHLNSSLGAFFSSDILQQFALAGVEAEKEEPEKNQDFYKEYRKLLFGDDRETGDCWPLFIYQEKMRKENPS